jgi:signal transduction histidine kinase
MANEKATGPTALAQILHDRSLRLAAGLAVAVAIPVAVLFYFQFRSLNAIEETSSVVLRQLSKDTADSLTRTIDESLKSVQIRVFLRITAARVEPLDLAFIEPVFVQNLEASPFAEAFYVYSEVTPPRYAGRLLVVDRNSPVPSEIPISGRFREDPDAAAVLVPLIKELALQRRAIVLFKTTLEGREKYIQVQVRWNNAARDVMTSFLAVAVDAERLRTDYFPALLRSELSGITGPTGFPPLVATVVDERNRVVFDSGTEPPTTGFLHERSFPIVFFDRELLEFAAPYEADRDVWHLRVGYGNRGIDEIVAASTQPQKALLAILALTLGFGVFFVARAAAREVRLAELKSNFVSSVSHDLKTPLALIQLFAETLELGRLKSTERAMEYYRIINSEARKLTRLIDNILDFSKMEAGLRPYKVQRQDLAGITEHVLGALQSQFTQNQFQVRFEQAGPVPPVLVDADAVKQAIENLLTNAMKYSGDSRDIVVRVATEHGFACVSVTDRGIGIPRRHQRRIFRKFYRIEADTVTGLTGPQGCGLGLAIVDHTMRGHGGHVRVESEPDRGSTFTLCFPIPSGAPTNEAHTGDRGRAADAARTA